MIGGMRPLVVIPAYNEAVVLAEVCATIPHGWDVLVVDDGSTDNTAEIAQKAGAGVVRHHINRGLGGALRTGFRFAEEKNYDAVLTMDADGQHTGADLPALMRALATGADVVIGARQRILEMPRQRQWYNKLGTLFGNSLLGGLAVDSQSGMRALRTAALQQMQLKCSRMEISSEIIAESFRLGLKVVEVPITVRYTDYSLSKGQGLSEGIKTAWRLFLRAWV